MRLVYGFGLNDADYCVQPMINGRQVMCKSYSDWKHMIKRAYSKKYQIKKPTYSDVTVCEEWRSFMSFRDWWVENHVDGYQLDKDLLTDNRQYSPKSCIYVPSWLNSFTTHQEKSSNGLLIGVDNHKSSRLFRSRCSNPKTGKQEDLGRFATEDAAHAAWKNRKIEIATQMKSEMDAIDGRIYGRIVTIINRMSY